ncbi:MAG: class I SAM-dependent methyltransferase, partial [Actinomycetota bacterium]|nr:class I SAM-dependent methyltransferase [Actinomycetota bacterium]
MAESETPELLWDNRYRKNSDPKEPSLFLDEIKNFLPDSGSVVDLAGGNGQNAIWFAQKGFSTTLIDISSVALNQA